MSDTFRETPVNERYRHELYTRERRACVIIYARAYTHELSRAVPISRLDELIGRESTINFEIINGASRVRLP